jgi:signal transduction histidine kinase
MAAHELRNPLQSIMGFSSIIIEKVENDIELKEFSEFISDAAKEMNIVLSDLLKSALDDSKNLELNISDFKLKELIKITVSQFQPAANKKNQKIFFNTEDIEQSTIKADRTKIKEVIENLISNAVKYSPHNSNININLLTEPDSHRIDFIDEGPGFSEADMKNIFGKFNRLSARPTGNESSTGLGLYFVKKIINQHGGKIYVTNNAAKGCTITIFLPSDIGKTNLSKEEEYDEKVHL